MALDPDRIGAKKLQHKAVERIGKQLNRTVCLSKTIVPLAPLQGIDDSLMFDAHPFGRSCCA